MTCAGMAGGSALLGAAPGSSEAAVKTLGALTEHKLPPLPYAYEALEPHLDAQTLEIHHTKHHAAYVTGLNKAEQELAKARAANDYAMVQHWSRRLAFMGAGAFLHELFWSTMGPAGKGGGGEPQGDLAQKIAEDFGSFAAFKDQFSAAAREVEGSGWAVLAYRPADKRLIVLQVENHQKLATWDSTPILCIDVWEHAYYLKYQNRRADFVAAWWNVVNWEQVAKNLAAVR